MSTMFSLTLKKIRIELKLTQQAFAEMLSIPIGTYRCWETGRVLPSFENIEKIIEELDKIDVGTSTLERAYNKTKSGEQ